jgi:hypothetical protein
MQPNEQKEQFSVAFIRAVAAVAGYNIAGVEVDEDSVDMGLRGNRRDGAARRAPVMGTRRSAHQAKCTATDPGRGDQLAFDLALKTSTIFANPTVMFR